MSEDEKNEPEETDIKSSTASLRKFLSMNFASAESTPAEVEQASSPPITAQPDQLPDSAPSNSEVRKQKKKKGGRGLAKFLSSASVSETKNTQETPEPIIEEKKEEEALELSFNYPDKDSQEADPASDHISPKEQKSNKKSSSGSGERSTRTR